MRVITVNNLSIQFDADQVTAGEAVKQARSAISQINGVLQRQPHGLAAQILYKQISRHDVEVRNEDWENERFWVVSEPKNPHGSGYMTGYIGLIDDKEGDVVAYAKSRTEHAKHLRRRAEELNRREEDKEEADSG